MNKSTKYYKYIIQPIQTYISTRAFFITAVCFSVINEGLVLFFHLLDGCLLGDFYCDCHFLARYSGVCGLFG